MSASFRIVKNQLDPYISATLKKLKDPNQFLTKLGILEREESKIRFKFGEGPDGKPWEPSIRALEENGQTLVKTGDLRRSIEFVVEGKNLYIGTNLSYAGKHQLGKDNLPARPFLGANEQTERNARLVFKQIFGK